MRRIVLLSCFAALPLGCSSPITGTDAGPPDAPPLGDTGSGDAGPASSDVGPDAPTPPPSAGWLVGFGGGGFDSAASVAASSTRVAVAGNFDGSVNVLGTNVSGTNDVVVALLDTNGTALWVRTIGALGFDEATGVALDDAGNLYVAGAFERTVDFDPGPAVNNRSATGTGVTSDAFVLSLDPTGAFRWATTFGSDEFDRVNPSGLAIDGARGRVYAVGHIQGTTNFGGASVMLEGSASMDGFLLALGTSNGAHVWDRTLRATDTAQLRGVAVAPGGDVLVAGTFTTGSITVGTTPTSTATSSAVVARIDVDNRAVWVHPYDGTGVGTRACSRIVVAPTGEAYVGCTFDGMFSAGSFSAGTVGLFDGCVLRLDAAGDVDWGLTVAGTTGNESVDGLALDEDGTLWVAGTDTGGSFGGVSLPTVGDRDVFLAHVTTTATVGMVGAPVAGVGTTRVDIGAALALGEPGRPILVGSYGEVGLMAEGDGPLGHGGVGDGFIWRHAAP